jgi:hypothetical protein
MYLAGVLTYGYLYLQDAGKAKMWKAVFEGAKNNIVSQSRRAKSAGSVSSVASAYGTGEANSATYGRSNL